MATYSCNPSPWRLSLGQEGWIFKGIMSYFNVSIPKRKKKWKSFEKQDYNKKYVGEMEKRTVWVVVWIDLQIWALGHRHTPSLFLPFLFRNKKVIDTSRLWIYFHSNWEGRKGQTWKWIRMAERRHIRRDCQVSLCSSQCLHYLVPMVNVIGVLTELVMYTVHVYIHPIDKHTHKIK